MKVTVYCTHCGERTADVDGEIEFSESPGSACSTARRGDLDAAGERERALAPLLAEVGRRAEKEWADDGNEFTVTIDAEMWQQIRDHI